MEVKLIHLALLVSSHLVSYTMEPVALLVVHLTKLQSASAKFTKEIQTKCHICYLLGQTQTTKLEHTT